MPQTPKPTDLRTLAQRLGVSATTVSRVLSGQGAKFRISAATQEKVKAEAQRSSLVVNQVARGLRLQSSSTIGLVIPDISNAFFATLAREVERSARSSGFAVLLADSAESLAQEEECIRNLLGRQVDGMIIAPVGGGDTYLRALGSVDVPIVVVDRISPDLPFSMLANDNAAAAAMAVEHLIGAGHRRIACIRGSAAAYSDAERVRGYKAALSAAKIRLRSEWIAGGDFLPETGTSAVHHLLKIPLNHRPTALVTFSSQLTLGALHALAELGLSIPQDLSLVAFDEQPWSALISPALTTVQQPTEEMAALATQDLLAQLKAPRRLSKSSRRLLASTLIQRKSVSPLTR